MKDSVHGSATAARASVEAASVVVPSLHLPDRPYADRGHRNHRLDLSVPGGLRGPRPVVVFIHGGAWMEGAPGDFESSEGQNFAALRAVFLEQGWATASVGYRFSSDASMPAQLSDVKAAVRWLRAHADEYGLDSERVAVVGESAGGHLAQLLGNTRDLPEFEGEVGITGPSSGVSAVVSLYGVSDVAHLVADRVAAGCGRGDAGLDSPEGRLLDVDPESPEGVAPAAAASPVTYISASSAPTLFLHGTRDCIVPVAQSERAAAALRAAGVRGEVTLIPVGHADPAFYTTARLQQQMVRFLADHLG